MKYKILLLLVFGLASLQAVSAEDHYEITGDYRHESSGALVGHQHGMFKLEVKCEGEDCVSEPNLRMCEQGYVKPVKTEDISGASEASKAFKHTYIGSLDNDWNCDNAKAGPQEFYPIEVSSTVVGWDQIGAFKLKKSRAARFLNVQLNVKPENGDYTNKLHQFHLTDKEDGGEKKWMLNSGCEFNAYYMKNSEEKYGQLLLNEDGGHKSLCDAWANWDTKLGAKIIKSQDHSLDKLAKPGDNNCKGDCGDNIKEVIDTKFTTTEGGSTDWVKGNTCSGDDCKASERRKYFPDGQIIVAKPAPEGSNLEGNHKKFYMCEGGEPSSEGLVVYGEDGKAHKCFVSDGGAAWGVVDECEDGVDNDMDGGIDDSDVNPEGFDNQCNGPDDDSEKTGGKCNPHIRVDDDKPGEIYAVYNNGDDPCDTEQSLKKSSLYNDGPKEPEKFDCEDSFDDEIKEDVCNAGGDFPSFMVEDVSHLEAAIFYPTVDYLDEKASDSDSNTVESQFVNSDGWKPGAQFLHKAEKKYSGERNRHKRSTWEDKDMKSSVVYSGTDPSKFDNAWIVSNAGNNHEGVSDPEFPGGFAGDCKEPKTWREIPSKSIWQCTGDPEWTQAVLLPSTETEPVTKKATVGMIFPPYIFGDKINDDLSDKDSKAVPWEVAIGNARSDFSDGVPNSQKIDKVRVRCYSKGFDSWTLASEEYRFDSEEGKSVDVSSNPDKPVAVMEKIKIKEEALDMDNQYVCEWEYIRNNGEAITDIGTPVELEDAKNSEPAQKLLKHFKEKYSGFSDRYTEQNSFKSNADNFVTP